MVILRRKRFRVYLEATSRLAVREDDPFAVTGFKSPYDILLQQVDRSGQQNDILHQEGALPAIAGKPATGSQPFGMNGMMVTVMTNVAVDPRTPKIPRRFSQNPKNSNAAKGHSELPGNQLAPRMPKTGCNQKNVQAVTDKRN
jgi:hypothetical protein